MSNNKQTQEEEGESWTTFYRGFFDVFWSTVWTASVLFWVAKLAAGTKFPEIGLFNAIKIVDNEQLVWAFVWVVVLGVFVPFGHNRAYTYLNRHWYISTRFVLSGFMFQCFWHVIVPPNGWKTLDRLLNRY